MADPAELLAFAHEVLDETDAIASAHFASGVRPRAKPDRTLVTVADTEVEARIRARIAERYPHHGVLGEEGGEERAGAEVTWIVDPIDATHNFVRGIPVFATLLACRIGPDLVVGVVSAPAMGERWSAAAGHGAERRARGSVAPMAVSTVATLAEGQLLYGSALALDGRVADLARNAWRDRGLGDFWGHMLVAGGSAEAMLEDGVAAWDMAAPYLIVTEAGGQMTDLDGTPSWTAARIVTSNGLVHDEVLARLRSG